MSAIIAIIVAYLIGSISSAILIAKFLKLPDPRTQGSGNAGATNILRTVGRNQALVVLIIDILKGMIAVWIGRMFGVEGPMLGFVALGVVVGHIFPIFFKFKGGKGVATTLGALVALAFWPGIITAAIWIALLFVFRYASLASVVAAIAAPILMLFLGSAVYAFPVFLITLLIVWKHKSNIERLRNKTENKVKF